MSLKSESAIAEREIICERAGGKRVRVTPRIGKPYRASDVDWACPVEAEGLFGHLADIHGIDSFQALILAQSLLRNLLRGEVEDGSTFWWADTHEQVDVEEMFGRDI
jgi:hypothetical protein